jgi:hypothetical protein
MRLTLQEMVSGAIAEATEREKLAQAEEASSEEKKPSEEASASPFPPKKKENGEEKKNGEDKEKESGLKCASAETSLVEKVASALDFINANMNQIDWEKVAVGEGLGTQAANAPAPQVGPGTGPGSDLATNMDSPTPGLQSTETGQATGQAQPPKTPGSDTVGKKDGQTNPATALETDMADVPGGTGEQPQLKQAAAKVARVRQLVAMRKQAANAENPAQISAGKEPLVNPNASAAEEAVPKLPGPAQAQANLVQTKDPTKPADVTKSQAKAEPKRQMGEVLDEPAQKKSTDPVLHQNLDAAAGAGTKLSSVQASAARAYLRKLAQAGEDPNATPEEKEKAKKLKEAVEAKKNGNGGDKKEKESQFGAGMGGGMGGAPVPSAPPPTSPVA